MIEDKEHTRACILRLNWKAPMGLEKITFGGDIEKVESVKSSGWPNCNSSSEHGKINLYFLCDGLASSRPEIRPLSSYSWEIRRVTYSATHYHVHGSFNHFRLGRKEAGEEPEDGSTRQPTVWGATDVACRSCSPFLSYRSFLKPCGWEFNLLECPYFMGFLVLTYFS
nr:hypothetical protein Iba_chr05aCG2520 [Ipomoea batatas]